MIRAIRTCRHEQLLAGKGSRAEPLGVIRKSDLIDQLLDGEAFDPAAVIREPLVVHESAPVFQVLEQFKRAPVRMAAVVDEYGVLQGIVTQTDLLEALAGDLPDIIGEEPEVIEREDGSLLLDGMMSAPDAFDRLGVRVRPANGSFHTIAGFALFRLGRLPVAGERFDHDGWRFEIVDIDGRRIDKLLASRIPMAPDHP